MLRFMIAFIGVVYSLEIEFDNYIGFDLDLVNEESVSRKIDLSSQTQPIIDDVIKWGQITIGTQKAGVNFYETFVIDKIDSEFTTSHKKLVPGATLDRLMEESNIFVDYGLFFHNLLDIDHYPTKVQINDNIATLTPIFR